MIVHSFVAWSTTRSPTYDLDGDREDQPSEPSSGCIDVASSGQETPTVVDVEPSQGQEEAMEKTSEAAAPRHKKSQWSETPSRYGYEYLSWFWEVGKNQEPKGITSPTQTKARASANRLENGAPQRVL